ncbi:MAG: signal peptidase I [Gammaproteobacteria bacterium]|nr:signal peptidase I [Gammaproteobacteria bacterium]
MDYDFSFFLALASLITGVIWLVYTLYIKRHPEKKDQPDPLLVEYAKSFFPVIFIVFLLRSFLVEPFRIPSGSMMPTLLVGDFILVNKFIYGIRLPVINKKIIDIEEPKRGDIIVFRYPRDPKVDYIKRLVGMPGDRVTYRNKQLYINGKPITRKFTARYQGIGGGKNMTGALEFTEDLEGAEHQILRVERQPGVSRDYIVPDGHYYVMGDNRDNSNDSRFWGTVAEEYLVGKAFFIWMNFDIDTATKIGFSRIGTVPQ